MVTPRVAQFPVRAPGEPADGDGSMHVSILGIFQGTWLAWLAWLACLAWLAWLTCVAWLAWVA